MKILLARGQDRIQELFAGRQLKPHFAFFLIEDEKRRIVIVLQ
jgi:hypothetical protein